MRPKILARLLWTLGMLTLLVSVALSIVRYTPANLWCLAVGSFLAIVGNYWDERT